MEHDTSNVDIVMRKGAFRRLWPFAHEDSATIYSSVGLARPFVEDTCSLYRSSDMGETWDLVADFNAINPLNTTTGSPFVTSAGTLLVPLWNALYYTHGRTWFSILRSEDYGATWETTHASEAQTYGNHFFQSPLDGSVYIGVGIGGGGHRGVVSYSPRSAILLRSDDDGRTWQTCLRVEEPTALYDGAVTEDGVIIVSARERCSVFRFKHLGGWSEIRLGRMARCVNQMPDAVVVSSDDAVFSSDDSGVKWERHDAPFSPLVLRYPTLYQNRMLLTSVGRRSLLIEVSRDFSEWRVRHDATRVSGSRYLARMAVLGDYAFIGDENEAGVLLRLDLRGHPTGAAY